MPTYSFRDVAVDTDSIEISGPEGVREVEPQVFDVLRYLIEQPGRLITKEELLDNVWGDRFVSESALTTRIKQARRALGDDGRTQWAIKTVHGRGYRFIAEVLETPPSTPAEAGRSRVAVQAALPLELVVDTRQRLVGRKQELEQSLQLLARSQNDPGIGWLWLLGEPGIGKTRLAAEVAREAQAMGHRVLFGRNNEDLHVPHQPFIEAMRTVIDHLDPHVRTAYVETLPTTLAPLLPGVLASVEPSKVTDNATDSATRRYQLSEAIAEWLIMTAGDAPLTLIIDDVHWASDSTLQLLAHLQQRPEGGPLNFVITARDTAPDINPRVTSLLASGQGTTWTEVVRLTGLSGDDALEFVGSDVALEDIMRQTAGNPLLLQAVNPADGSVDIQSAVHRRLASLDESVHETLKVASILGLEFELRVVAAATSRDELDVLDELEQAIAARLLDDVGADRFRFAHSLIRSSLRADLSSARQARVHKRAAQAIDEVFGDEKRHLPALAFHTAIAAESDASMKPIAVERLERAAKESMTQLSFDDAAELLEHALRLVSESDHDWRARLTVSLGIAQTRSGASMTGARTFEEAISIARLSDDATLRIEAALRYEDAIWRPGMSGLDALGYLAEAEAVLDTTEGSESELGSEPELRTRLAIARLRASALSGQTDRAEADFSSTHRLAQELGSPDLEGSLLNVYLSQVLFLQGLGETETLVRRLEELQPHLEDGEVALHAVHVRALHALLRGQHEHTRDLAVLMAQLQERSHSTFWRFIRMNQEAMEAFYLGDLATAEHLAEECLALADELPEEDGSGTFGLRMFMIRREQDRLTQIAPLVRHVLSAGDVTGVWTPGLALLLCESGSREEAAEILHDIKEASFVVPPDAMWSTVLVFLIETMVALGDVESCRTLHRRFARLSGTNVMTGSGLLSFGSADRYLGMLSFVLGDLDEAEQSLGLALEADATGGSAIFANESRIWLSRVRRAQGHGDEANAMLDVVEQQAQAGGLARLARIATTESRT